jgi:hypothetical protein
LQIKVLSAYPDLVTAPNSLCWIHAIIGVRVQDCFTPEHTGLMVLGGFGLVVYVIGCAQHPSEPVQLDASASNWVPYLGGPAAFRS